MKTSKENLSITFTSMKITNIPTLGHSSWTCTKFDGSNLAVWVAQMEKYFLLNDICEDQTKICVGAI